MASYIGIGLRDRSALSRPRSRGKAGQTVRDEMTLAIMFLLGLTVGGVLVLGLFIYGAMDDMNRLHDEDDGESL